MRLLRTISYCCINNCFASAEDAAVGVVAAVVGVIASDAFELVDTCCVVEELESLCSFSTPIAALVTLTDTVSGEQSCVDVDVV